MLRYHNVLNLFFITVLCCFVSIPAATLIWYINSSQGLVLDNGNVLGGDFIAFYTGGKSLQDNPNQLYDITYQNAVRDRLFSDSGASYQKTLPFVYPPLVAVFFSLLAKLPFASAYYLYLTFSATITVVLLLYLCHVAGVLKRYKFLVPLMIAGFIPLSMNTLMGGQISWLGLAIVTLLYLLLRRGNDFSAGLIMSLSYYKPPLFLFMLIALLLWRGKRFGMGFVTGGVILILLSLLSVGWEGCVAFLNAATGYTYGQELVEGVMLDHQQGAGIFGLLISLFVNPVVAGGILAILFFCSLFAVWKLQPTSTSDEHAPLWFAWVTLLSVGLSIQCVRYDLALLLPAFFIALPYLSKIDNPRISLLLVLIIAAFYSEWIMRWGTHAGISLNASSFLFIFSGVATGIAYMSFSQQNSPHLKNRVTAHDLE